MLLLTGATPSGCAVADLFARWSIPAVVAVALVFAVAVRAGVL